MKPFVEANQPQDWPFSFCTSAAVLKSWLVMSKCSITDLVKKISFHQSYAKSACLVQRLFMIVPLTMATFPNLQQSEGWKPSKKCQEPSGTRQSNLTLWITFIMAFPRKSTWED